MKVKISELESTVNQLLSNMGYSDAEVAVIADILMYAQLRGNNQGIAKLLGASLEPDDSAGEVSITRETKLSKLINGNHNLGMLVMTDAVQDAISMAKAHGFGIVGTHNTASSTGAIGYYGYQIAREGLIGFTFAGSPETVSAEGGYEPLFGTNPISIALPTENDPIVLDMATSAIAWFGLVEAKAAGKQISADIAYDKSGNLTTDPSAVMDDGAIRPFDLSHKGAGLAFIVEALTGPLVMAGFTKHNGGSDWGNLVMAIDPELLVDLNEFKANMSKLVSAVKESKKLPGVEEIYLPGERGQALTAERKAVGEIEIEDNLWNGLLEKLK